jgi:hypothetical protein
VYIWMLIKKNTKILRSHWKNAKNLKKNMNICTYLERNKLLRWILRIKVGQVVQLREGKGILKHMYYFFYEY